MKDDNNYPLTLFEACEILSKSRRTVGKYIRRGLLNPTIIKSKFGTKEYRFAKNDVQRLKVQLANHGKGKDETGWDGMGRDGIEEEHETVRKNTEVPPISQPTMPPSHPHQNTESHNREFLDHLKGQIQRKDQQIRVLNSSLESMIERNRETNILLRGFQQGLLPFEPTKTGNRKDGQNAESLKLTVESIRDDEKRVRLASHDNLAADVQRTRQMDDGVPENDDAQATSPDQTQPHGQPTKGAGNDDRITTPKPPPDQLSGQTEDNRATQTEGKAGEPNAAENSGHAPVPDSQAQADIADSGEMAPKTLPSTESTSTTEPTHSNPEPEDTKPEAAGMTATASEQSPDSHQAESATYTAPEAPDHTSISNHWCPN